MTKTNTEAVEAAIFEVARYPSQSCGDFDCDAEIGEKAARRAYERFAALSPTAKTEPSAAGLVKCEDWQFLRDTVTPLPFPHNERAWSVMYRMVEQRILSAPTRERELLAQIADAANDMIAALNDQVKVLTPEKYNEVGKRLQDAITRIDNLLNEGSG